MLRRSCIPCFSSAIVNTLRKFRKEYVNINIRVGVNASMSFGDKDSDCDLLSDEAAVVSPSEWYAASNHDMCSFQRGR